MHKLYAAAMLAIAVLAAPPALAQAPENAETVAELQALRTAAQKDKRALVASTLNLTEPEAKKFWPTYIKYETALENFKRERNLALEELVARDKPMTNRYAKNWTNELLKIEELEIKARRKMHNAVMRALPPKKAAQYLQIEFKLRAAQAYDIAVAFPLEK
jgi:Spy/CpxP family protein refolding chaperone